MVEVFTTADFDQWLRKLKDRQGRLRILARLDRLAHGNPGDAKNRRSRRPGTATDLRARLPGLLHTTRQPDRAPAVRRRQVDPAEGHHQGAPTRCPLAFEEGWRQWMSRSTASTRPTTSTTWTTSRPTYSSPWRSPPTTRLPCHAPSA